MGLGGRKLQKTGQNIMMSFRSCNTDTISRAIKWRMISVRESFAYGNEEKCIQGFGVER